MKDKLEIVSKLLQNCDDDVAIALCTLIKYMLEAKDSQIDCCYDDILISIQRDKILCYNPVEENYFLEFEVKND